ncbi:hypothetical protein PENTCL1PPCAC_11947, partial [Pristionchus entomophagus]
HYQVSSCHGCKSFFRRVVQHKRRLVCDQQGKCRENGGKRLRCRSCRFARCVEAGMNIRGVGIVKDIKATHQQDEKNKQVAIGNTALIISPMPIECRIDRLIDELIYLDNAHQKLRRSQFHPTPPPPMSVEWCLLGPSRMAIDFGEMPISYPHLESPFPFVPMEERIRNRINLSLSSDDFTLSPTFKQWITVDLVYTIEWLKTLSFFHRLRECEKIRLARNITQAVAYLTAAFDSYEQLNSDVTIMPDGTMLCQGKTIKESSVEHNKWFGIISRLKALKVDKKEYVLIKAIMACDPDDDIFCAENREMLQKERENLSKSLISYVLAR